MFPPQQQIFPHINKLYMFQSDDYLKEKYDCYKTKPDFISKGCAMEALKKEIAGRIVLKLTTKTHKA